MANDKKPKVAVPAAEEDQVSRKLLAWLNTCPGLPCAIRFEYLPADAEGMALSTIQAAYITRRYILGGYEALYQFRLVYRTQPGGSNDKRLEEGLVRPTLAAIRQKKRIALANKETLVCAGELVMAQAERWGADIVPVDSEHSAIFQCIQGRPNQSPCRIVLTASGGPFRTWTKEQIQSATVEQALRHPNWSMGRKITIDSASMVNKALEVIEARHLFGLAPEKIQVVIHPQSIIHSGVEFADGATLVQMGQPDMRVPIAYAMSYPERLDNVAPRLDLTQVGPLTFEQPDFERFPALKMAYQVLETGGSAPVLLNGANEIAVERVLAHRLPFWRIAPLLEETLSRVPQTGITCVEDVYAADRAARKAAEEIAARWAI